MDVIIFILAKKIISDDFYIHSLTYFDVIFHQSFYGVI